MTPATMEARLERFSLDVLAITGRLLRILETTDMADQLRRAATAAYANYGAACVARSHADFTSKIGIALEEADESRRWLRLLRPACSAAQKQTACWSRPANCARFFLQLT
jgi:four helix bundle protein